MNECLRERERERETESVFERERERDKGCFKRMVKTIPTHSAEFFFIGPFSASFFSISCPVNIVDSK